MYLLRLLTGFGCRLISGVVLSAVLFLSGCIEGPLRSVEDICQIFLDRPQWKVSVRRTAERWGVPPEITVSFVYQESSFKSDARPPRRKLLWIIPWKRPTTAFGYAQAIDSTWARYQHGAGSADADRTDFADAVDFIGWYNQQSYTALGLSPRDARSSYLAYHEGHDGYQNKSYRKKKWLIKVAEQVATRADRYRKQLKSCPL